MIETSVFPFQADVANRESLVPDRTFQDVGASKSVDGRIVCKQVGTSEAWIDGL